VLQCDATPRLRPLDGSDFLEERPLLATLFVFLFEKSRIDSDETGGWK
jgi:hypothetical protein